MFSNMSHYDNNFCVCVSTETSPLLSAKAFDRQSKDPGLDTQRSGSVPFFTEKIVQIYIENSIWS